MERSGDRKSFRNYEIVRVVASALNHIDPRLMEHGERVAYIAHTIAGMDENYCGLDPTRLFMLCLLHDIGAYKTEEIDNMTHFETQDTDNHAIYGYLFLKSTVLFADTAQSILYHHTPYPILAKLRCPCEGYAALIFLADRIDILLKTRGIEAARVLREQSDRRFRPDLVRLFFKADAERRLCRNVLDGSYRPVLERLMHKLNLTRGDVSQLLNMLVYAVDFRSPYTVTHTAYTVEISAALARLMSLPDTERERLRLGSFLHDIGKITTPVHILEKPGPLTPEETAVMRGHVVKSEEIIRGIVPDSVCDIAVRHHEKLNGTGYPRGLTAAELTRPQRILAAADIMSALTGRRSYKEGFPKERVLTILDDMRERGEICPEVCGVIFAHYDEIMDKVQARAYPIAAQYAEMRRAFAALQGDMKRLCEAEENPV